MQLKLHTHHSFLQHVHTQATLCSRHHLCLSFCHLDKEEGKVFISFKTSHIIDNTLRTPNKPNSLFKMSPNLQGMVNDFPPVPDH